MALMLSATSISRRVKPPSPDGEERPMSFATANLPRRRDADDLARVAAGQDDRLRRWAGADAVEQYPRDPLPAAARDANVCRPAAPLASAAGERARMSTRLTSSHYCTSLLPSSA